MLICKGKKYSGYFVQAAGLKMQGIHTMQYDDDENTQGTDWSVGFLIYSRDILTQSY